MAAFDLCYHCNGTGERDFLSGARCYECNGTGMREEPDDDELYGMEDAEYWLNEEDPDRCRTCDGSGEVPTCDYESYFGAMMKPCPECHGTTDGIGHGKLS